MTFSTTTGHTWTCLHDLPNSDHSIVAALGCLSEEDVKQQRALCEAMVRYQERWATGSPTVD